MTHDDAHALLEQLAQLQQDVCVLRDWTALLDDALQEFGQSLHDFLSSDRSSTPVDGGDAWPTEGAALALRIRRVRKITGLSRAQLAHLAQVAPSTVGNVETGRHKPSPQTLRRLLPLLKRIDHIVQALIEQRPHNARAKREPGHHDSPVATPIR